MKYRLVHNQNSDGYLLITDIDQGLPIEHLDEERKQASYLSYNHKRLDVAASGETKVVEDKTRAGFIDLVPSDKVLLSVAQGVIKGLKDNGFLSVVEVPAGALAAPTISSATHDTATPAGDDGVGTADDGSIVIDGTNFTSFDPDVTTVSVTDGATTVTLSDADTGVSVSDTQITITGAAHSFGAASGAVTEVSVTANTQTATSAVTEA